MKKSRWVCWLALGTISLQTICAPLGRAEGWITVPKRVTTVEQLARQIDKLEKHIDQHGSVVAKVPDVWGEERLTAHRWEFEQEMLKDLTTFNNRINASIRRADSAFLQTATAVSAAIGRPATSVTSRTLIGGVKVEGNSTTTPAKPATDTAPATPAGTTTTVLSEASPTGTFQGAVFDQAVGEISALDPQIHLDQKARYLNHLHEIRRINEGDDTKDLPGYALNLVRVPVSVMPGDKTRIGHGAEVTMTISPQFGDELLPITFRNFATNDVVNQYSQAVMTIINNPAAVKNDKLFEALKITLDQYQDNSDMSPSGPRFNIGDNGWWYDIDSNLGFWKHCFGVIKDTKALPEEIIDKIEGALEEAEKAAEQEIYDSLYMSPYSRFDEKRNLLIESIRAYIDGKSPPPKEPQDCTEKEKSEQQQMRDESQSPTENSNEKDKYKDPTKKLKDLLRDITTQANVDLGRSSTRNAQLPVPISLYSTVYGQGIMLTVGIEAYRRVPKDPERQIHHYHDIEQFLREEISFAYDMLQHKDNMSLWQYCTPELARAVQTRQKDVIDTTRVNFFSSLRDMGAHANNTTGAFAWAIIVESALLNEKLIQDMREVATSHGCQCLPTEWMPFYLPDPPLEARDAFQTYVKCRWPVHVFHVDPVTQDQNVADEFASRRELQMSLAVAVATGQLSVSQAVQFQRRLELDVNTIALNRTVIGFSHGEDTFGYRFQPRVQTPETESNAQVVFRDMLIGGPKKDHLLKDYRIEPGMRECVALVVAPAFIRQFVVDVHSDWFPLHNTDRSRPKTTQAVALSRDIQSMQQLACLCQEDAQQYRDGEVYRLLRRVDQLSKELPMQTIRVEFPIAKRLGGHRIFQPGGNFDRSPQLYTWYGAPGIDATKPTRLFLAGENFRLQGTYVIAGGVPLTSQASSNAAPSTSAAKDSSAATTATTVTATVTATVPAPSTTPVATSSDNAATTTKAASAATTPPYRRLISDAVMEIEIPAGVNTYEKEIPAVTQGGKPVKGLFCEVRVATFHGVSGSIEIPVIRTAATKASEEAKTAAKEVVAEAVKAHVSSSHFDRLKWAEPEILVRLNLDKNRMVTSVNQQSKATIQVDSDSPFRNDTSTARFRGWLHPQFKGAAVKTDVRLGKTADMDITLKCGGAVIAPAQGMAESDLERAVRSALANVQIPTDLESIEVQGFAKYFEADSHLDAQPVIRFDNRLKVKLEICETKCPKDEDVPAAGSTKEATPFDEPALPVSEEAPTQPPLRIAEPQPLRRFRGATSKVHTGSAPTLSSGPIQRVSAESTQPERTVFE